MPLWDPMEDAVMSTAKEVDTLAANRKELLEKLGEVSNDTPTKKTEEVTKMNKVTLNMNLGKYTNVLIELDDTTEPAMNEVADKLKTATALSKTWGQILDGVAAAVSNGPAPVYAQGPDNGETCKGCGNKVFKVRDKKSEKSPDYRCSSCGHVAWINHKGGNTFLSWKAPTPR